MRVPIGLKKEKLSKIQMKFSKKISALQEKKFDLQYNFKKN